MSNGNERWAKHAMEYKLANEQQTTKDVALEKKTGDVVDASVLEQFLPGDNLLQANPATT